MLINVTMTGNEVCSDLKSWQNSNLPVGNCERHLAGNKINYSRQAPVADKSAFKHVYDLKL